MDIATVQKRKFLNNIYRLLYAEGSRPSEQEVRKAFAQYFSRNKPGLPIQIEYNLLQISDTTDVDVLNELMVNNLFNLEILYDAVFENNQQVFSVVTALNNKLEGLRARRIALESKVDQLLFANSNTDGFYYSFAEPFSSLESIDMNLTTAFVDLVNGNVTIPKITNAISDTITTKEFFPTTPTMTAVMNGSTIVSGVEVANFDMCLDGLNDTYWNYEIKQDSPGIASVNLDIPVNTSFSISRVDGLLLTASPCTVYMRAIPVRADQPELIRVKGPTENYNRFSFSIPADNYSSITLSIIKSEPDRFESSSSGMYVYSFGLRELVITSAYHDTRAILVSAPITIPSGDNSNLAISALALEANSQILPGTSIQYYVAADSSIGADISSFNWLRIEPTVDQEPPAVVALTGSNLRSKTIDTVNSDLSLIADNSSAQNANELNPFVLPFSEKTVYRVCAVDPNEKFIEPYILSNLSTFRHYGILLASSKIDTELYTDLQEWSNRIGNDPANIQVDYLINQVGSVNPGIFSANVALLETKLLANSSTVASHTLTKSQADFNLSVYLNGVLIADLPKGMISKTVEWNFVSGLNNIVIGYDKNFSGLISFNLMTGRTLDEYGTVFSDYFSYLDPIQFRNDRVESPNTFTIDTVYGRTEILSSKKIANRSLLKYYSNKSDLITAVRYRADLVRFDNPLQSPILDSIRLKFKHNDQ